MIEVEVKAQAHSLRDVEKKLRQMGALKMADVVEEDTYYSHPKRNFALTDEALRIRMCAGRATITYKGPKLDARSKSREEINIEVLDVKEARLMLERLGFSNVAVVRKKRRIFHLWKFELCLDRVECVGEYVEIEARVPKNRYRTMLNSAISLLEKLHLGKTERKSYLELLLSRQEASR